MKNCNNYNQFIVEDDICKELKLHNVDNALKIYHKNFPNNDFESLSSDFQIRSLKNHLICLLVSLSRTLSDDNCKLMKLKGSCNNFIINIENMSHIDGILKVGECAIRSFGQVIKSSPYVCNDPIISYAIEYIEDNLDTDITLDKVASRVHLSKNYFSSLFYKKTKVRFSEFVNHLRVLKAKDLLINCDFSLSYISNVCGFKNQSYFSTIFKKYVNASPLDYRNNNI